ncbi:MAG: hypothetical protein ACREV4_07240 [Gammaproteobacteria bacterium]
MKIGVFCERDNQQAIELRQCINTLAPGSCTQFVFPLDGSPEVAIDETGVYWDGTNVSQLDIAYIHGFSYTYPVVPAPLGNVDWSVWQVGHVLEQQGFSFLLSAFMEMERHGVKLLNPTRVYVKNFTKADLLEDLRQAGFPAPRLVCTNDTDTTKSFIEEVDADKVVWRPATGRATWQLFRDRQREHLISAEKPPILLAEVVEGPLIRSYLIDGQPLLYLERYPPDCIANPGAGMFGTETLERFQALECADVSGELRRLVSHLSLHWGQISFVLRDGRPWIYDVDPDPMFEWLPELFSQTLTEGLASRLLDIDAPASSKPLSDCPQERPTLFLRRMLYSLFELEHKKYSKEP